MLIWKAGSKVVCPVCRLYFLESRDQLCSSPGKTEDVISFTLNKSKPPQKGLWPQLGSYGTGLDNAQTETVETTLLHGLPYRDCQAEKLSGKNAICLKWWCSSCDGTGLHRLQLCNSFLRDRTDWGPLLKMSLLAEVKRNKDNPHNLPSLGEAVSWTLSTQHFTLNS